MPWPKWQSRLSFPEEGTKPRNFYPATFLPTSCHSPWELREAALVPQHPSSGTVQTLVPLWALCREISWLAAGWGCRRCQCHTWNWLTGAWKHRKISFIEWLQRLGDSKGGITGCYVWEQFASWWDTWRKDESFTKFGVLLRNPDQLLWKTLPRPPKCMVWVHTCTHFNNSQTVVYEKATTA